MTLVTITVSIQLLTIYDIRSLTEYLDASNELAYAPKHDLRELLRHVQVWTLTLVTRTSNLSIKWKRTENVVLQKEILFMNFRYSLYISQFLSKRLRHKLERAGHASAEIDKKSHMELIVDAAEEG